MGAGLVPAPSTCAVCSEPFIADPGRAKYSGRLGRACDSCRHEATQRWNAKALKKRKAKSKVGKTFESECSRCGDAFVFVFNQRIRTVCDPCRSFDVEWSKYGLNHKQIAEIRSAGRCAICGVANPGGRWNDAFHIDHNHSTGQIRGVLCSPCNRGIGFFNDDPDRLRAAAEYLDDSRER